MQIKSIFLLAGMVLSIYAGECENKYLKDGCEKVTFDIGDGMNIVQYRVIYDDDQDGVRNSLDKCLDTPLKQKVDKNGCHKTQENIEEKIVQKADEVKVISLKVNFDKNKDTIKDAYSDVINDFAQYLNANAGYKVKIVGHTDSWGPYEWNIQLSKKRANAIMLKLISLGIDEERLSFDGVGPNEPMTTSETQEGRIQNRRIEATLTKYSDAEGESND